LRAIEEPAHLVVDAYAFSPPPLAVPSPVALASRLFACLKDDMPCVRWLFENLRTR